MHATPGSRDSCNQRAQDSVKKGREQTGEDSEASSAQYSRIKKLVGGNLKREIRKKKKNGQTQTRDNGFVSENNEEDHKPEEKPTTQNETENIGKGGGRKKNGPKRRQLDR